MDGEQQKEILQAQIQNSYFIDNDLEMMLRDESLFIDGNFQTPMKGHPDDWQNLQPQENYFAPL